MSKIRSTRLKRRKEIYKQNRRLWPRPIWRKPRVLITIKDTSITLIPTGNN